MTFIPIHRTNLRLALISSTAILLMASTWNTTGASTWSDTESELDSTTASAMMAATMTISVTGRSAEIESGGGVLFTDSGTVITNVHVVDGATSVDVRGTDGRHTAGRVVRVDPFTDLAVLQLSDPNTLRPPLKAGNSDRVHVGDRVFLIAQTQAGSELRRGRITNLYPVQRDVRLIQTSIPIRSEEAGSALVNAEGHVVGIVTLSLAGNGGLASATAINSAKDLVTSILAGSASVPLQEVPNETSPHSALR